MRRFVPSSPHLFRPVKRAMLAGLGLLLLLAAAFPAPLRVAADPATPPNPAKSAWFLLWVQELVSWDKLLIHAVLALGLLFVALPWLPVAPVDHAAWWQRANRSVIVATVLAVFVVIALTAVGLFLRGPNWRLVLPF